MYHPLLYYLFVAFIVDMKSSQKVYISDACHGQRAVLMNFNVLHCNSGFQVNITEVRFYQKSKEDHKCPIELSNPETSKNCCVHNTGRCNWTRTDFNDVQSLQTCCEGLTECKLHSLRPVRTERLCNQFKSQNSSVRSIKYTCILRNDTESSTSKVTNTTTTEELTTPSPAPQSTANATSLTTPETQNDTSTSKGTNSVDHTAAVEQSTAPTVFPMSTDRITLKPENDKKDVGVLVGAVLGGLAVCVIVIVLVVCLWRRARSREKPAETNSTPARTTATNPGYFDVVYSETAASPNIYSEEKSDFGQGEEEDGSELYSNINDQEGEYAELADFKELTDKPKPIEYAHILGELPGSFPVRRVSDYDHVAVKNADGKSNSGNMNGNDTGHYFEVKKTYDTLQRNDFPNEQGHMNKKANDPYNVLGRPTTDTVKASYSMR